MTTPTRFATTEDFDKGGVEIIGDDAAPRYLFSNMFEVASKSPPWERVVIARNLEFTVECARAEGSSPWYLCAHDETVLCMQGAVEIKFLKPENDALPEADTAGAVRLEAEPTGQAMGYARLKRGHMALLPAGAAYRITATGVGVLLLQSLLGAESRERWATICQH